MKRYKSKFEESRDSILIPDESKNSWANSKFKNELNNLEINDIVWLQDKTSKYQGYYLVIKTNKGNSFKSLGSIVTSSIFKKYNQNEVDVPILKESKSFK